MRGQRESSHLSSGPALRLRRWFRDPRELDPPEAGAGSLTDAVGRAHWHFHPELELMGFTRGRGVRVVGDHVGWFSPGEVWLVGAGLPHGWLTMGASSGFSVRWSLSDALAAGTGAGAAGYQELVREAGRGILWRGALAGEMERCVQELERTPEVERWRRWIEGLGRMATAAVPARELLSGRECAPGKDREQGAAIGVAVRHLLAGHREVVTLGDLLRLTRMSRVMFARQFRRLVGRPFTGFLAAVRLQVACDELRETERTVIEVALGCGFCHASQFNRVFRRHLGCTPSEYRRAVHEAGGTPPSRSSIITRGWIPD